MSDYTSYDCPCGRKHDVGIECAIGRRSKSIPRIVDCRCSACDWSGRAPSNALDCPECGEEMRVDENMMAEDFEWNDPDDEHV